MLVFITLFSVEQAPPILQVHHHQERVKREENDATSNDKSTKVKKLASVISMIGRQHIVVLTMREKV